MREDLRRRLADESLTTSWLGSRMGIQPGRIESMRRAGELLGVRPPGSQEFLYPAWQFDEGMQPHPLVPRLIAAAREAGIDDARLYEVMTMRAGLGSSRRLFDAMREGAEEYVFAALISARR